MPVQENSRQLSFITRLRNRFRYGLATQEILDRISAVTGFVIRPYYFVRERLQPEIDLPAFADVSKYEVRDLTESDMDVMARQSMGRHSTAKLVQNLRNGKRSIGIFFDGDLVAYCWFRFDCAPVPTWMTDLIRLRPDEAYLFDTQVLPAYRGRRLAPLIRYRVYEALNELGRSRLYSISLAFNASTRRFKGRLHARESELRLLIGFKRWRAVDVRLRAFDDQLRTPRCLILEPLRADPTDADS
jgi:hypothetical protein